MFDVDWWSLLLPFAYIFVLGSSLYVFSTIYRKRKAGMSRHSLPSPSSGPFGSSLLTLPCFQRKPPT